MARILQMVKVPDGTLRVLVQGIERISINGFDQTEPYIKAKVSPLPDTGLTHTRSSPGVNGRRTWASGRALTCRSCSRECGCSGA
jgi:ATP-dependent Lon protease